MDGEQKRLACVIRHLQKFDWDNEKAREVSHTVCPRSIDPFYIIVLSVLYIAANLYCICTRAAVFLSIYEHISRKTRFLFFICFIMALVKTKFMSLEYKYNALSFTSVYKTLTKKKCA